MKIFRIILLGMAMALFAVNFWAIDYQDFWAKQSLWAYFRIAVAFVLVLLLLFAVRRDFKQKPAKRKK